MKFRKGQSGNLAGKPRGTPNRVNASFKEAVRIVFEDLGGAAGLLAWARKDPASFYRVYARLVPAGMPTRLALTGAPTDQAVQIVAAMAAGEIAPSEAAQAMDVLAAQARIVETTELARRLDALERRLEPMKGGDA